MKLLFSILLFLLSFSANADTARVDSVLIINADSIKLAQKTTKRLKIIPTKATQILDKAKIKAYLDKVYDQAVMHWDVEIISQYKPTITLGDNGLDIGEEESRKDLTEEMKALRDDFKKQGLVQKDDAQTYYVFLVDKFSDASIDGYFPQSKLYGFVKYSSSEPTLHKTLAHELGHGAGNLEHPFVQYGTSVGATPLLMDYSNGVLLSKQDWGQLHNPGIRTGWKDEVGEGLSAACETELSYFQNLVKEGSSINYLQLLRAENSNKEVKLGKLYGRENLVVFEINVNDNLKINYFKNYWQNSVSKLFRIDQKIDKTNTKYAFIYYDPNTPIGNDSKLDAHIAVWEPDEIIRKDTPYCYRKIELPYGTTAGGVLVDQYPNLVFKGFQIGAGVYFFGNLLAGEGLVLASENAALFSKNCLVAMSLDLGFQVAVTKLIKQMDNSTDPSVKLSDISYASLLASCGTGNVKGCDAKCMASIGGLTGFADNFIKQTIFEKKDFKDLDIGQMMDNATIQAVGAAIVSKSISFLSNKITKEKWAKLVEWLKKGGKVQGAGKAGLLTKFKDFANVKTWINTLDDVADASLLSKLDNLEASYFTKLDADLVHATYGSEIKALLKESPDDLVDVWKKLKDDPAFSWELQKTGGSRWEKWSQREFFKDITAKGKGFETNVCLATFKNRTSAKYLELKQKFQTDFGKNLDDYDMYSQVQLKYDGDNYFVADQLFVKYKTNAAGKKVVDDLVVIENKLSSTTPLTTPQATAFTKNSFTVRSVSIESATTPGKFLNSGQSLNFSGTKQWYKVHDGANGDVISGISKMN